MATSPTGIMKFLTRPTYVDFYLNKTAAKSTSLSGHYKTLDRTGTPFYTFKFRTHEGFKYSTISGVRPFLEDLYGRTGTENIERIALFDDSERDYDLTTYSGDLNDANKGAVFVRGPTGDDGANIYINTQGITVGNLTTSSFVVKKGDYISPRGSSDNYMYTYQVTEDVTFSGGVQSASIRIPVNRDVIAQSNASLNSNTSPTYSGGLKFGSDVRFDVKITKLPTYTILPGDRIKFNGEFEMVEVIL
tara:strand:- start:585 stop:1325 length:741 start_codon:yes stop_codon:yes gene_type:complete